VVLNIVNPLRIGVSAGDEEDEDEMPPPTPGRKKKLGIMSPPNTPPPPPVYDSPPFNDVQAEFKDQLLFFATEILLKDLDLLKNITERGNKILLHPKQLKQLIAILYLQKEDRERYDELIEIETEKIIVNNCFCKDCFNPFYCRIKNIYVNSKVNFLTTAFAVNMQSTFRINLDLCLT
jgi:hypothetical protein